jgi:methionine--tRNA ligase beta chain
MKPVISYEDFAKLDLRIAKITAAEFVEGADKLLKLTLDVGELGERTIAAGIKQWYSPEELVGKLVPYLANLEPRQLRGVTSQGMLIAAGADEAILLQPDKETAPGTALR